MAVSKVIFGNTTVMDITDSTVSASKLKSGETAYGADGTKITGSLVVPEVLDDLSDVVITSPQTAQEIYFDGTEWINYGAKILLTFDDDFKGQTITLTKGQTTITKTAPLDSNTMNLYVNETGTWTISSTISGDIYETEVNVTTFGTSFDAELSSVPPTPEGATVLPTDDIQTWLHCANIWDKAYTTLAEVLADRSTFETLIADSNACDYMARSTNWASGVTADATAMLIVGKYNYCANKLLGDSTWAEALVESDYWEYVFDVSVPKMTSNTTPSGVANASANATNAWKVFDKDFTTYWNTTSLNNYVEYEFTTPIKLKAISFISDFSSASSYDRVKNFKVEAYNGNNWDVLITDTAEVTTSAVEQVFVCEDNNTYTRFRFYIIDSYAGNNIGLIELQLYGRTDNANYIPLVPKMTSNTTPSGVASANISPSGFEPYKAFDKNTSTRWASSSGNGSWLEYDFGATKTVKAFSVYPLYHSSNTLLLKSYKIQGSNDNFSSDINDLYEETLSNTNVGVVQRNFTNVANYRYYRLLATSNSYYSSGDIGILELQFYDRTVQTNIVHSSANDTIYYMEDGSPVIVATTNSDGDGVLDFSSLEDKEYTFYSSVAKDPSNLSNDYSKTIRITKSEFGGTTEMYLMPDTVKTLYWWGYKNNIESMVTGNGWSRSSYTFNVPTYNTNYVDCYGNGNTVISGVSSTYKPTVMDRMCTIAQGVTAVNSSYGNIKTEPSKAIDGSSATRQTLYDTNTLKFYDNTNPISDNYFTSYTIANRRCNLYGMWYE